MAITKEEVLANKERFIDLIQSIDSHNIQKEKLLAQLEKGDFYTAPASTRYHSSFEGGLVYHSLLVYDTLVKLVKMTYPEEEESDGLVSCPYSDDTLKIVALLHDFSKMNFYTTSPKNKKVYSPNGSKTDVGGNYDWVTELEYTIRDLDKRFLVGNHEANSLYMVQTFVTLTVEEASAILNHMGGLSKDSAQEVQHEVYAKYPLATLLFLADMYASQVLER